VIKNSHFDFLSCSNFLQRHTRYRGNLTDAHPHVQFFWDVLEEFNQTQRRAFLRFVWGRERLPCEWDFDDTSVDPPLPSSFPYPETTYPPPSSK
jgi:hypothetical protein